MKIDRHSLTLIASVPDRTDFATLPGLCRAALRGGATLLELNPKNLPDDALLAVRAIATEEGAPLIFRDDADAVLRIGADGLLLSDESSLSDADALRRTIGTERSLGATASGDGASLSKLAFADWLRMDFRLLRSAAKDPAFPRASDGLRRIPAVATGVAFSDIDELPAGRFDGVEFPLDSFDPASPEKTAHALAVRIRRAKLGFRSLRGVLFDMDGTLLDSMGVWDTIGERCLRLHGKTPQPGFRDRIRMLNLRQASTIIQQEYGVDLPLETLMDEANRLVREFYVREAKLKPGVLPILQELAARKIPMRIVTATNERLADMVFRRLGLRDLFAGIDSCSATHYGKESEECFLNAAAKIASGLDPSSVAVFEDSALALETASRAGFRTIGLYDASAAMFQERVRAACGLYLSSFKELSL